MLVRPQQGLYNLQPGHRITNVLLPVQTVYRYTFAAEAIYRCLGTCIVGEFAVAKFQVPVITVGEG